MAANTNGTKAATKDETLGPAQKVRFTDEDLDLIKHIVFFRRTEFPDTEDFIRAAVLKEAKRYEQIIANVKVESESAARRAISPTRAQSEDTARFAVEK